MQIVTSIHSRDGSSVAVARRCFAHWMSSGGVREIASDSTASSRRMT